MFEFSSLLAIRYLQGILELPTFWLEEHYTYHEPVMKTLFQKTETTLKDIGVDSSTADSPFLDTESIDIFVDSILTGVQTWKRKIPQLDLPSQMWSDDCRNLVRLLKRHVFCFVLGSVYERLNVLGFVFAFYQSRGRNSSAKVLASNIC